MTPALALAIALAVAGAPSPRPQPARPTAQPSTAAAPTAPVAPAGPATIYRMQVIGVRQPLTPELAKQLEPFHTLDEIEALLKANRISFVWGDAEVRSTEIPPQILSQLAKLPPHEPFIAPEGQGWIASVILEQHPAGASETPPKPQPAAPP
jgi:hypothetical protein